MKCCKKCGKEINTQSDYCKKCGNLIIIKASLFVVLIAFLIKFGPNMRNMRRTTILNSYDMLLIADNCNCEGFSLRSCRFNYGVKDDELKEINLSLIEDKSNFNVVSVQDDKVTYYNYNIWYQMYKENGYGSNFSPEILNKYQQDYEYNTKEKEVFEKITTLLNQYELKNIKYYIPTKNNYYLFNTSDNSLYKYDIRTNKINKYLELNTCDITYLYEK